MIKFSNVSFRYDKRKPLVLDHLNLDLIPGHIYGLLGKNGVGKSTIFRLITGLNPVKEGTVLTLDKDPALRLPSMLQDIFLLPEDIDFPAVNIVDYGRLYGAFYPQFSMDQMLDHLREFEIQTSQKLNTMSQGQRKKAYIAFALACNTRILLMDEPTNGLDIPSKMILRRMLANHQTDDRMMIISTHQVRDLEGLINAVIIMDEQKLRLCETAQNLLQKFHLGPCEFNEDLIYKEQTLEGFVGLKLRGDLPIQKLEALDLEILFNTVTCGKVNLNAY